MTSQAVPADKLSPFKFYQYLLTTVGDEEVIRFLRMLTFVPLEDLEALERSMQGPGYKPNTAQRLLAAEVTSFVHGQQGLEQALKATEVGAWVPAPVSAHLALHGRKLACQPPGCIPLCDKQQSASGIGSSCTDRICSTSIQAWILASSAQQCVFNPRHVIDWCASY